ncbi:S1 RNA-binding domain-containing protein [Oscillospiraceae bacterium MB08-C2-2]|nr:S1 RNA-binding domain-containing protein [Oscillospiraceae bacterium MB08-C2-2]
MNVFYPEGILIDTAENKAALRSVASLQEAMATEKILEARAVVCDFHHNLIVELGCCKGFMPKEETVIGISDGSTRDIAIISRVNKPVCFVVTDIRQEADGSVTAILSRQRVQRLCLEKYISALVPGDVINARVTHLESFGCFVDIGCGVTSLIPINSISVSRISHPRDRFRSGKSIKAVVKSVDENGRVTLSHKELLGTWEENARNFVPGETVSGIIRSVESYGIFVELTPNLAGLAEPREGAVTGQHASVYIKNLIPEKMKVKLIIVDAFEATYAPEALVYYITDGHLDYWRYSPECADRVIETTFK